MSIQASTATRPTLLKDGNAGNNPSQSFSNDEKGGSGKNPSKNNDKEVSIEVDLRWFFLIVVVAIAILAGYWIFNRKPPVTPPATFAESLTPVAVNADAPVYLGKADAPVTVVEYSDFECPYCKAFHTGISPVDGSVENPSTYQKLLSQYVDTGKVKVMFKPFSAVPTHNPAFTNEVVALYCAGEQQQFWQFNEKLFENTKLNGLGIDNAQSQSGALIALAQTLNMKPDLFQACLKRKDTSLIKQYSTEVTKVIEPAFAKSGQLLGTPLFVVCKTPQNGAVSCEGLAFMGAYPIENFKQVIEQVDPNLKSK